MALAEETEEESGCTKDEYHGVVAELTRY